MAITHREKERCGYGNTKASGFRLRCLFVFCFVNVSVTGLFQKTRSFAAVINDLAAFVKSARSAGSVSHDRRLALFTDPDIHWIHVVV